jgi:hypothetical protein
LQTVVASGWVRGAVTGLGVLNLGMAFWEIFHFKQSVAALQLAGAYSDKKNVPSAKANQLPHHQRADDVNDNL